MAKRLSQRGWKATQAGNMLTVTRLDSRGEKGGRQGVLRLSLPLTDDDRRKMAEFIEATSPTTNDRKG